MKTLVYMGYTIISLDKKPKIQHPTDVVVKTIKGES